MNWSDWESCKNEWKYKCRQAASDFNHHAIPLRKQPTGNIVLFFFFFFQHANDPKHTASAAQAHTWIEKHKIKHYQSWNGLPRAWIATLLQHGIILTENKTNSSLDPKKSFVGTLFLPFMYLQFQACLHVHTIMTVASVCMFLLEEEFFLLDKCINLDGILQKHCLGYCKSNIYVNILYKLHCRI